VLGVLLVPIETLMAYNRAVGHYFFSPDAMRFFKSRVQSEVEVVPDGWLFITSERYTDDRGRGKRYYRLRHMSLDGDARSYRDAGAPYDAEGYTYATRSGAVNALRRIARALRGDMEVRDDG